jgi:Ca2+-binding EF-hand superfamily protein
MKDIKEIFNFMDLDSDGIVTQDDFKVFDVKNKYVLQFFQTFPEYPYQITND